MKSKIDMQQVMLALESVRGAPVLTSNQCADLAKALQDLLAMKSRWSKT